LKPDLQPEVWTVPIVRATGGLDDTIEPWDARTGKGTGFKFSDYTGEALLATIKQALLAYRDPSSWQTLMRNGMSRDFPGARRRASMARSMSAQDRCGPVRTRSQQPS